MDTHTLNLAINAINRTGPVFRQIGLGLQGLGTTASATGRSIAQGMQVASRSLHTLGTATVSVANQVRGALTGLAGVAGRVVGLLGSVGGLVGIGIGAGSIAGGMAAIAKTGIDMNLTLQGSQAALTRMAGSAAGAARLIAELRQEALTSALTFKELLPTAQSLVAVLGPQSLGAVVPIIRAFGDAAVSLRVDSAGLDRALLGFRQLLGRDFAQQEEINQISENLPGANITAILKRNFGTADTETLKDAGITGRQVGEAIFRGLQQAFGGAQARGAGTIPLLLSGIQDTFNDLSASVTRGLTGRVTSALKTFSDALGAVGRNQPIIQALSRAFDGLGDGGRVLAVIFGRLMNSGRLIETLLVPLEAVGNVIRNLAGSVPQAVAWIERLFNARDARIFTASMLALAQTVLEQVLPAFRDMFNADRPRSFFEATFLTARGFIKAWFGVGRVVNEVGRIIESFWQDQQDQARETAKQIDFVFRGTLMALTVAFQQMSIGAVEAFLGIVNSLNAMVSRTPVLRQFFGGGIDIRPLEDVRVNLIRGLEDTRFNQGMLKTEMQLHEDFAPMRRALRLLQDPRRGMSFGDRIAGAFEGRFGAGPEIEFERRFQANFERMFGFLFGRQGAAGGVIPGMGAPAGPAPATVTTTPASVGAPRAFDFSPVHIPGRGTISRYVAELQGLIPRAIPDTVSGQGPATASASAVVPEGPSFRTFGGGQVNVNVNVAAPPLGQAAYQQLFSDPGFQAAFGEFVAWWMRRKQGQAGFGMQSY